MSLSDSANELAAVFEQDLKLAQYTVKLTSLLVTGHERRFCSTKLEGISSFRAFLGTSIRDGSTEERQTCEMLASNIFLLSSSLVTWTHTTDSILFAGSLVSRSQPSFYFRRFIPD